VARIVVTRHERGMPTTSPGSSTPVTSKGTGWLIGPRHVITNHHVINARSESEPLAAEPDLRRQAETASVQFDYDHVDATGTEATVRELSAWVAWNSAPALDYAILELAEPVPRAPLTLSPTSLLTYASAVAPVNIIQHPGGNPKQIGVRNNLTSALLDDELHYFTDTMRGSSGSPVCDDLWRVVALHRAEYRLRTPTNFQGKSTAWVNRGVRIDRIIEHLRSTHEDVWLAMGAAVI
jgi:V8-like Glu-specific endopeptidase